MHKFGPPRSTAFEGDGRGLLAITPEEVDHLAIRADTNVRAAAGCLCQHALERAEEACRIRPPVDHEPRERLACVEKEQLAIRDRAIDVAVPEGADEGVAMVGARDDDEAIARVEPAPQEASRGVEQVRLVLVELHQVMTIGRLLEQRSRGVAWNTLEAGPEDIRHGGLEAERALDEPGHRSRSVGGRSRPAEAPARQRPWPSAPPFRGRTACANVAHDPACPAGMRVARRGRT